MTQRQFEGSVFRALYTASINSKPFYMHMHIPTYLSADPCMPRDFEGGVTRGWKRDEILRVLGFKVQGDFKEIWFI